MNTTQDWITAYKELCTVIENKTPEIKHIDLDHDQLLYEQEEYPFPETALFIAFASDSIQTLGLSVQDMNMQIRFTFAFDTLSDTYHKSDNQEIALSFGAILRKLHKSLQNLSGANFSSLNRIAFGKATAPEGCIAYYQTYACIIRDYAAMQETTEGDLQAANIKVEIQKGTPDFPEDLQIYDIPL